MLLTFHYFDKFVKANSSLTAQGKKLNSQVSEIAQLTYLITLMLKNVYTYWFIEIYI